MDFLKIYNFDIIFKLKSFTFFNRFIFSFPDPINNQVKFEFFSILFNELIKNI